MQYRSLFLGLLCTAFAVTACSSADPSVAGAGADYRLINVTPSVVMQLQQQQKQTYSIDEQKATPDSTYTYHIGPGDVLYVKLYVTGMDDSVSGYASTNEGYAADSGHVYNEVTVKEDGTITIPLPLIGALPVSGKTLLEANQTLHDALTRYYKQAQSAIEVSQFKSHKVQVTGEVGKPSQEYLNYTPLHVLEALSNAGGVTNTADLSDATIKHKDGSIEKVNLFALMNNGDASQNFILHDGDTLNVPANYGNKIFVLGAVRQPSLQYIKSGRMSVMEALSNATGLLASEHGMGTQVGSYEQIYVIRGAVNDQILQTTDVNGKTNSTARTRMTAALLPDNFQVKVYHLDCSDGTGMAMAAQFPLEANDVIYVSETPMSEWSTFIGQLLPADLAVLGQAEIYQLQK